MVLFVRFLFFFLLVLDYLDLDKKTGCCLSRWFFCLCLSRALSLSLSFSLTMTMYRLCVWLIC